MRKFAIALFLLSSALHAANAAIGDTLTYTTDGSCCCKFGSRWVSNINDGNVQAPSDWLTNGEARMANCIFLSLLPRQI